MYQLFSNTTCTHKPTTTHHTTQHTTHHTPHRTPHTPRAHRDAETQRRRFVYYKVRATPVRPAPNSQFPFPFHFPFPIHGSLSIISLDESASLRPYRWGHESVRERVRARRRKEATNWNSLVKQLAERETHLSIHSSTSHPPHTHPHSACISVARTRSFQVSLEERGRTSKGDCGGPLRTVHARSLVAQTIGAGDRAFFEIY
ncbi:hypothetical protein ACMFMF_004345 [Clarireedia jacksonii]